MKLPIRVDLPELTNLSTEEQRVVLEEAYRSVHASHGRMSNVPHYIGCSLTVLIALAMTITGGLPANPISWEMFIFLLLGAMVYFGALVVGVLLWRRSISLELQKVVKRLIADRGGAQPTPNG